MCTAVIIALAVTGLMYVVVFKATSKWTTLAYTEPAHVTPVPLSGSIAIFDTDDGSPRLTRISRSPAADNTGLVRLSLHQHAFIQNIFANTTIGFIQWAITQSLKPFLGPLGTVVTGKNAARVFHMQRWSLSFVYEVVSSEKSILRLSEPYNFKFSGKNVGSLISLKEFPSGLERLAGQADLPIGQSSVNDDRKNRQPFQKQFVGFTSPVFLAFGYMCSGIFCTLGVVLLYKTLWGVRFYGTVNVTTGFVLVLLSAILIWIGQWSLFSVLGLLP